MTETERQVFIGQVQTYYDQAYYDLRQSLEGFLWTDEDSQHRIDAVKNLQYVVSAWILDTPKTSADDAKWIARGNELMRQIKAECGALAAEPTALQLFAQETASDVAALPGQAVEAAKSVGGFAIVLGALVMVGLLVWKFGGK